MRRNVCWDIEMWNAQIANPVASRSSSTRSTWPYRSINDCAECIANKASLRASPLVGIADPAVASMSGEEQDAQHQ